MRRCALMTCKFLYDVLTLTVPGVHAPPPELFSLLFSPFSSPLSYILSHREVCLSHEQEDSRKATVKRTSFLLPEIVWQPFDQVIFPGLHDCQNGCRICHIDKEYVCHIYRIECIAWLSGCQTIQRFLKKMPSNRHCS